MVSLSSLPPAPFALRSQVRLHALKGAAEARQGTHSTLRSWRLSGVEKMYALAKSNLGRAILADRLGLKKDVDLPCNLKKIEE